MLNYEAVIENEDSLCALVDGVAEMLGALLRPSVISSVLISSAMKP